MSTSVALAPPPPPRPPDVAAPSASSFAGGGDPARTREGKEATPSCMVSLL